MDANKLYLEWIEAEKKAARKPSKENKMAAVRAWVEKEEARKSQNGPTVYKPWKLLKIW